MRIENRISPVCRRRSCFRPGRGNRRRRKSACDGLVVNLVDGGSVGRSNRRHHAIAAAGRLLVVRAADCQHGRARARAIEIEAAIVEDLFGPHFPQNRVVKGASLGRIIGAERDISEHVVSSSGAFQNGTDTRRDNTRKV
jgi:hypothetical protein